MRPTIRPDSNRPAAALKPRVLLVDGNGTVLSTLAAVLSHDFDVTTAGSARDALLRLEESRPFDAVCSAAALGPGPTGRELLLRVAQRPEHIGRVLLAPPQEIGASTGGYYVLPVPCDPRRLVEVVTRAVEQAISQRRVSTAGRLARRVTARLETGPRAAATVGAGDEPRAPEGRDANGRAR